MYGHGPQKGQWPELNCNVPVDEQTPYRVPVKRFGHKFAYSEASDSLWVAALRCTVSCTHHYTHMSLEATKNTCTFAVKIYNFHMFPSPWQDIPHGYKDSEPIERRKAVRRMSVALNLDFDASYNVDLTKLLSYQKERHVSI